LEYLEVERNCSKLTVRNYEHYLNILVDYLTETKGHSPTIDDVNMESMRRFRLHISRMPGNNGEMTTVTQGYYIIAARSFLKWLVKHDVRALEPEKLEVPKNNAKSLKFLEIDQVERLLAMPMTSEKTGLRDRAILELLFSTGLRVSELVSLDRDKVNLETREFGVIGKGGKARVVFLSERSAEALDKYLKTRRDKYKPLFVRMSGKVEGKDAMDFRLTARSVQKLVKKYVHKAKLPVEATPHTIRHSLATDLLRGGADLRSIQEILGHKNISTTQIYTHVTDARLREVHERYHSGNHPHPLSPIENEKKEE